MRVLGIETSCDETAVSIVEEGKKILSNVVSSQIDLHKCYGGVVPELACRRHVDLLLPVIKESLKQAGLSLQDIDLFAAARGPGLIGALMIGLNAAKSFSLALNKPFIGINHIEAHLYAAQMSSEKPIDLPALGLILSGGHSTLAIIKTLGEYEIIGETADDALGEAFDKCAKILGLSYPGGPIIEKLARSGKPLYPFKAGQVKENPLAFSFSGLKTAVLYTVQKIPEMNDSIKEDIAASFQHAAFTDVQTKVKKALQMHHLKNVLVGGGVINSQALKEYLKPFNVFYPSQALTLDNGAMIAGLAYHKFKGVSDPLSLPAIATLSLSASG